MKRKIIIRVNNCAFINRRRSNRYIFNIDGMTEEEQKESFITNSLFEQPLNTGKLNPIFNLDKDKFEINMDGYVLIPAEVLLRMSKKSINNLIKSIPFKKD